MCNEILEENKDNKAAQSLKRTIEFKMSSQQQSQIEAKKPQEVKQEPINKEVLDSYIKDIEVSIKTNWTPPVGSNLKKASVKFTVNKEGELINNQIYSSSGLVEFDKSALDAIELSKPFPPLPDKLNRETLDIIFTFDFNIQ